MNKLIFTLFFLASFLSVDAAEQFVSFQKADGLVTFTESGSAIAIQSEATDYKGVQIAVQNLFSDLESATGVKASTSSAPFQIIIGSIDK
ncbi:MAG: hypothetical protein II386_04495, partial [Bacteroidaceae bacterium]|nr:hypothetical protein [Bacteroidaceae bacterium]